MARQKQKPPLVNMDVTVGDSTRPALGGIKQLSDGQRVLAPVVATFTPVEDTDGYPTVEIEVDVHGGRLVVTRATLIGSPERPLQATALRNWSIEKLAYMAMTSCTLQVNPDGSLSPADDKKTRSSIVAAVRQRTAVDEDRLATVARLYNSGGVHAVQSNLHVSRPQAYRLIKHAREAGMLPPKENA